MQDNMEISISKQQNVPYKIEPWSTTIHPIPSSEDDTTWINGTGTEPPRKYWDIISLRWIRIIIMTVTLMAVLIALIGNILVILVIYRRCSLRRNPTILFILNLAICDIISCLVYRPLLLTEMFLPFTPYFEEFVNHLHKCKVASYFKSLFAAVGFHIMVAISQERLLLIVYPLQAKVICTLSRTAKIVGVIWFIALLLVLPGPLIYTEIISLDINGTIISFCGYFSGAKHAIIYHSLMFAFYFVIPLIILTIYYAKIFNVLYRRQEGLDLSKESGGGKSMRICRNLAKMMVSVSVIFAICWGPHFIFFLYVACGGKVPENGFFTATVVEFLPVISSILNPLLYTLNSRTFRSGIKSIVFCTRPSDETTGARSFANVETVTQSTQIRRGTFLSSFRLGGSKADKLVKFCSPDRRNVLQYSNGNSSQTGHSDSFCETVSSSSGAGTSCRRATFNNNQFEVIQVKNTESSSFLGELSGEFSSGSSRPRNSPELSVSVKQEEEDSV